MHGINPLLVLMHLTTKASAAEGKTILNRLHRHATAPGIPEGDIAKGVLLFLFKFPPITAHRPKSSKESLEILEHLRGLPPLTN